MNATRQIIQSFPYGLVFARTVTLSMTATLIYPLNFFYAISSIVYTANSDKEVDLVVSLSVQRPFYIQSVYRDSVPANTTASLDYNDCNADEYYCVVTMRLRVKPSNYGCRYLLFF